MNDFESAKQTQNHQEIIMSAFTRRSFIGKTAVAIGSFAALQKVVGGEGVGRDRSRAIRDRPIQQLVHIAARFISSPVSWRSQHCCRSWCIHREHATPAKAARYRTFAQRRVTNRSRLLNRANNSWYDMKVTIFTTSLIAASLFLSHGSISSETLV